MKVYNELLKISKELRMFYSISNVLSWDNSTYIPNKARDFRGDQFIFLDEQILGIFNRDSTHEFVNKLKFNQNDFDDFQRRNVEVFIKEYEKNTKIPKELSLEETKLQSISFQAWLRAKNDKNFKLCSKELENLITIKQKINSYLDENKNPQDVCISNSEPGFDSQKFDVIFNELKPKLISLLTKIRETKSKIEPVQNIPKLDRLTKEKLINDITSFIGLDNEASRIDEIEHPQTFGLGLNQDIRIAVNYHAYDDLFFLFAGMHEAGHAIHFQNIPKEYYYLPMSLFGGSQGINESQAKFFEKIIGKSKEFWEYYYPKFRKITNYPINLDSFIGLINKIEPTKIRMTSDEITFNLHIILRHEIEKGLFNGSININELPSVWNEKMESYLGQEITNDNEGVIQDSHWWGGSFGVFQSHVLGNIYSSQLYDTLKKELDFDDLLVNGKIGPIKDWLVNNVHKKTNLYDSGDLIKRITGENVNNKFYLNYLEERYCKT